MKILEIIPDLRKRAGAEVFFSSLCKELSTHIDLEIVVVVIWNLLDDSFKELTANPRIKFYCCGKEKPYVFLLAQSVREEDPYCGKL